MADNRALIQCGNEDDEWFYDSEQKKKQYEDVIENEHPLGSVLLIVHSAAWCGSCANFKNNLRTYYDKWNEDAGINENVKVLIVSGDKDKEGYEATMEDVPWHALPYGHLKRRNAITKLKTKTGAVIGEPLGYPHPIVLNG